MATIVSFGGKYAPLGIDQGVNCLYLEHNGNEWRAFIQPNGSNRQCPLTGSAPKELKLEVYENILHPDLDADDVPPVARWDWDATNKEQYIGIGCGKRYCEIGRKGFKPAPGLPVPWEHNMSLAERPQGFAAHAKRVYVVKGWFDRQLLAVKGKGSHGGAQIGVVPSTATGVVVPYPTLNGYSEQQFAAWRKVAYLYIDDKIYDIPEKHNLRYSPPGSEPNILEAWFQPAGPTTITTAVSEPMPEAKWEARYAHNPATVFSVTFRPHRWAVHHKYHIAGTSRWRWDKYDETTWIRCPLGCCESN